MPIPKRSESPASDINTVSTEKSDALDTIRPNREGIPQGFSATYLIRDNDRAYGHVFTSRVRAMGIRDRPISPHSPWQNGYAERLIGTLHRGCLDQMLIFGEAQLRKF